MKALLLLLTAFFATAILLIAGFQFLRLIAHEFKEMVLEAWHSPELHSNH